MTYLYIAVFTVQYEHKLSIFLLECVGGGGGAGATGFLATKQDSARAESCLVAKKLWNFHRYCRYWLVDNTDLLWLTYCMKQDANMSKKCVHVCMCVCVWGGGGAGGGHPPLSYTTDT